MTLSKVKNRPPTKGSKGHFESTGFFSVLRPDKALGFAHMDSFMPMRSVLARQVLSKSNQKLT